MANLSWVSDSVEGSTKPGRPRDPSVDRAILETALRMLVDQGYARMSIQAVAAAAGVGKTAIYRRYGSKRDLVIDALAAAAPAPPMTPELEPRRALRMVVETAVGALIHARAIQILATFLNEEEREPELIRTFRERLLEPRREMLLSVLSAAAERGEIRSDANLEVVTELTVGGVVAHYARTGAAPDEAWIDGLVDTIWAAVRAP